MSIYERIKDLAEQQKISLQKVATDLGFSENYIYNLKYKKSPSSKHLLKIADYFNVSVEYLTGNEDFNPKAPVLDIVELANQPKDFDWDTVLSAGGKPIPEADKELIRRLFAHKLVD